MHLETTWLLLVLQYMNRRLLNNPHSDVDGEWEKYWPDF